VVIANAITSIGGKGSARKGEANGGALQIVRWGGLGVLTWLGTIAILYYTVVPLIFSLVDAVRGRGVGHNFPIVLLTAIFAVVIASYLVPRGWKYFHATTDPYIQEEILGEARPRLKEFRYSLHLIRRSLLTMAGVIIIVASVTLAILGPYVSPMPYNPSLYEKHVAPGQGAVDVAAIGATAFSTTSWVNGSFAFASDGRYASSGGVGDTLVLKGFAAPWVFGGGTVRAVDIGVRYFSPESHSVAVAVSWDEGAHWSPDQVVPFQTSDSGNLWYLNFVNDHQWTPQELNGTHTWVRVTHVQAAGPSTATMFVDYVEMRATFVGPIHPWGTNELGEDILAGILYGAGTDIRIGVLVVFGAVAIGVVLGVFSGYLGRGVDEVIMRITDMFLAVPGLILAIAFAAVLGRSLDNILIALMLVSWPGYTRLVRGQVLSIREVSYVEAARAVGAPTRRIVLRHILPNVLAVVIVAATLDLGTIVIGTAALSFIGLGAQPYEAEWGIMIARGYQYMISGYWWEYIPPGLAIFLFVLAFNLFGDGLRDILDPRLRR
jgi:peptide/nickel transport system permease protein